MSYKCKSPTMEIGPEVKAPVHISSPRYMSPKAWCPPPQPWCINNRTPPQGDRNHYYNQYHGHNGYRGSPRQWSPNRWELEVYCRRSWGSSPRAPHNSNFKHSPENASVYNERKNVRTQGFIKQKRGYTKEISHYYSPSMVEDPWAELQARDTKSTPQNPARIRPSCTAGSQAPL